MTEDSAFGWACAAPWCGIAVDTVRPRRADAQAEIAGFYRYPNDATTGTSWRRAYRQGWRCIRVSIAPALGYEAP